MSGVHLFTPANSQEEAEYLVIYNFNIGAGTTKVSSSRDFVYGGKEVHSSTSYPRQFEIAIVSKTPETRSKDVPSILWQAELYSQGSSSDMSVLADIFIPQMFQRYGKTVTNEQFEE